ncbi:helix-turn-helix transcriptional regulator [Photorhabdus noenieputensis]|uniref:helix-turn-helix transcriptional regulator n=1 Tax=Photorhabdus noenieputensis TaxID=1208607 RepID=UPI001BD37090|nr:PAS and helix-turn-helix domain-containing protein [Photorhabdus noenieputensis]MBS9436639.1 helix-turn-helix transcriptional regulator [Photorhabdus noenieputensis]MCK3668402.1 helix-turn-helix transcriptional regulator [Photorhabdus noenieputensis]
MHNKLIISPQVINTLAISNDPWGIKDKNSCFIYGNKALNAIKGFSDLFDFEGFYDDELPWDGAEFAKEYIHHDQKVMKEEKSYVSLETHVWGGVKTLSSYFCEKSPIYHENGDCLGIIYHLWKAQDYSLTRLFYGKLPASIIFQPPTDLFTPREWDVIFLSLHKYTSKQIGRILNISYRTVEHYTAQIYRKVGVRSARQLEEYCRFNNYDLYVPERFLRPESSIFV